MIKFIQCLIGPLYSLNFDVLLRLSFQRFVFSTLSLFQFFLKSGASNCLFLYYLMWGLFNIVVGCKSIRMMCGFFVGEYALARSLLDLVVRLFKMGGPHNLVTFHFTLFHFTVLWIDLR